MKNGFLVKNITKSFNGIPVICDFSASFKKGVITGIIGSNGSGKTTLLNIFSGLVNNERGAFIINGSFNVNKIKLSNLFFYGIARTFQDSRLFNQMSVLNNLLSILSDKNLFSAIFSKHKKQNLEKAEKILKKINLWEKRNQLAGELSYGQKKLLEIARIIAVDAKIIFLDEPFAGLSLSATKQVCSIIRDLREKNRTIILVEHNQEIISKLCDYVYVMDNGKILIKESFNKILSQII